MKLEDLSHEEQQAIALGRPYVTEDGQEIAPPLEGGYDTLMDLRREAYERKIQSINIPAIVRLWATRQEGRFGPIVKVHHNFMPWLAAFMVVRYGEEPAHWPNQLTAEDEQRVNTWDTNRNPDVKVLNPNESKAMKAVIEARHAALFGES